MVFEFAGQMSDPPHASRACNPSHSFLLWKTDAPFTRSVESMKEVSLPAPAHYFNSLPPIAACHYDGISGLWHALPEAQLERAEEADAA